MGKITVYTATGCVNSTKVIRIFQTNNIPFTEINTTLYPFRADELHRLCGTRNIPRILFNEENFGGVGELEVMEKSASFKEEIQKILNSNTQITRVPSPPEPSFCASSFPFIAEVFQFDELLEKMKDKTTGVKRTRRTKLFNGNKTQLTCKGTDIVHWLKEELRVSAKSAEHTLQKMYFLGYFQNSGGKTEGNFSNNNNNNNMNNNNMNNVSFSANSNSFRFVDDAEGFHLNGRREGKGSRSSSFVRRDLEGFLRCVADKFVADDGRINFDLFRESDELKYLNNITLEFQTVDLEDLKGEELAVFFINVYNAMVIHSIALHSRQSVNTFYTIGSLKYTLSDILDGVLRGNKKSPFKNKNQFSKSDPRNVFASKIKFDPRFHFALISSHNCSPIFRVFSVQNLEESLQWATERYCADEVEINNEMRKITLTPIFQNYPIDFGKSAQKVLEWICKYLPSHSATLVQALLISGKYEINYQNNNWNNEIELLFDTEIFAKSISPRLCNTLISRIRSASVGNMTEIDLSNIFLIEIPKEIFKCKVLEILDLSRNSLIGIQDSIVNLSNLKRLYLNDNRITNLPPLQPSIEILDISFNPLTSISSICKLPKLQSLYCVSTSIDAFPPEFISLSNLRHLNLSVNQISIIPNYFSEFSTLSTLDLSSNQISDISPLPKYIEELYLARNQINEIPENICEFPDLEVLDVSFNLIKEIPDSFCNLRLITLNLANNKLQVVTKYVKELKFLQRYKIDGNPLTERSKFISKQNNSQKLFATMTNLKGQNKYTKGGSIIDLIMAGSLSEQANQRKAKSKLRSSEGGAQMIMDDKAYFIEDGKTYYAKRTLSNQKCGFVTLLELSDYTIANSKLFYHDQFNRSRHSNFLSNDENYGYMVLSILHDPVSQSSFLDDSSLSYKALIRTSNGDKMYLIPSSALKKKKSINNSLLITCKEYLSIPNLVEGDEQVEFDLLQLEEKLTVTKHKVGVLFTTANQTEEDQFYSNEHGSEKFEQFLTYLADKIPLKNWEGFAGGLDTDHDRMGKFSYYTQAGECQIMYHISTYLPYKPNDTQQIERKCHIGNDVVVIIWQDDPSCSFDPSSIASQFNTVFIVVRLEPNSDPLRPLYRINVTSKKEVGTVDPSLFYPPLIPCDEIRNFMIEKILNSEQAAWNNLTTFNMAIKRARKIYLTELWDNFEKRKARRKQK